MAVAMVTGAGGAIGSAVCRLLAAQGYRVAALDLSEPVQGAALGATAALIVGTFAVVMSATTINIAIVPMMQEFAVSHRVAQLFSSLFLGATVLTAPLAAWLSRRWGARQVFLGVLLLYALASLAATFSGSFLSMLLARGLQGACAGVIQPLSMFLVLAAAPPERQGRAMSLYGLGVSLIGVLTASAGSAELAGWLGLAPAGSAAAAPATVLAGIALLFVAALGVVRRLR